MSLFSIGSGEVNHSVDYSENPTYLQISDRVRSVRLRPCDAGCEPRHHRPTGRFEHRRTGNNNGGNDVSLADNVLQSRDYKCFRRWHGRRVDCRTTLLHR